MWGGECEINPPEHYSLQCTFGRTNCCFQWSLGCCRFPWAVVAWVFGHCSSAVALELRKKTAWFVSFFTFHPFVSEKRGRKRNSKYRMKFSVKLLNNQTLVLWLIESPNSTISWCFLTNNWSSVKRVTSSVEKMSSSTLSSKQKRDVLQLSNIYIILFFIGFLAVGFNKCLN